jgi:hypothetical protein
VEFFLEREAAEAIGEVRKDEPGLTEKLRVEAIESTSRVLAKPFFVRGGRSPLRLDHPDTNYKRDHGDRG